MDFSQFETEIRDLGILVISRSNQEWKLKGSISDFIF